MLSPRKGTGGGERFEHAPRNNWGHISITTAGGGGVARGGPGLKRNPCLWRWHGRETEVFIAPKKPKLIQTTSRLYRTTIFRWRRWLLDYQTLFQSLSFFFNTRLLLPPEFTVVIIKAKVVIIFKLIKMTTVKSFIGMFLEWKQKKPIIRIVLS